MEKSKSDLYQWPESSGIEDRLAACGGIIIALIIAVSVIIRVFYFAEITRSPAGYFHRAPQSDMYFFHEWAKKIVAGDYLSDRVLHPLNPWQRQLAQTYFESHPEIERTLIEKGFDNPARALWNEWYGGKRFHQEPVYPYLIALTYMIFGEDVRAVFAWQMIAGVLVNILIFLIARRFFSVTTATLAALFSVLCSPLLFYEAVLVRSTLITFTTLAIVVLSSVAFEQNTRRMWFALGFLLGLAIQLKMSLLLVALGAAVVFIIKYRGMLPVFFRNCTFVLIGAILAMSPAIVRNVSVGVSPLALSSVGAVTFACTNTVDYSPDIPETFPCSKIYVPEIMGKTGGNFTDTIIRTLETHGSVSSYVGQVWEKFVSVWTWYEKPNNVNFYYFKLYSIILGILPVTFTLIGAMSIIGMAFAAPRLKKIGLLYTTILATLAPMLVFYCISRFRSPLTALLIPFAAYGSIRLISYIRLRPVGMLLVVLIALPPVIFYMEPEIRWVDHLVAYDSYYRPLIKQAEKDRNHERSYQVYGLALEHEPTTGPENPPGNDNQYRTARIFHNIHRDYADLLRKHGRDREADMHDSRAADIKSGAMKYERDESGIIKQPGK